MPDAKARMVSSGATRKRWDGLATREGFQIRDMYCLITSDVSSAALIPLPRYGTPSPALTNAPIFPVA